VTQPSRTTPLTMIRFIFPYMACVRFTAIRVRTSLMTRYMIVPIYRMIQRLTVRVPPVHVRRPHTSLQKNADAIFLTCGRARRCSASICQRLTDLEPAAVADLWQHEIRCRNLHAYLLDQPNSLQALARSRRLRFRKAGLATRITMEIRRTDTLAAQGSVHTTWEHNGVLREKLAI
jgi:hypothetical protein